MPPEAASNDLSNSAIALLCEIGEFTPDAASHEQKQHLDELLSGGFVEADPRDGQSRYRMTAKAQRFLSERGAGLNES